MLLSSVTFLALLLQCCEFWNFVNYSCFILYNINSESIFNEKALQKLLIEVRISGDVINNIRYANDTVLLMEILEDRQALLHRVDEVAKNFGISITGLQN